MKKKGKITVTITIGLSCLALSIIMFMQFKLVNETDITSIENMREEELRAELGNWKEMYEEANAQYEQKSQTLQEYKEKAESDTETSALVNQELERVNLLLGKTDVEGEGITITMQDTTTDSEGNILSITNDDLNKIVNELKLAGAEAISINDERIINMSDIFMTNDNTLMLVNGQRIIAPYVIKAIGDQTYLFSALSLKNSGFIDTHTSNGETVELVQQNNITIPAYSSSRELMSLNYAKEVEEE